MRSWNSFCLLLSLVLLFGCVETTQKAHEIAAQNLYHDLAYENAAQPGPSVVVLPGKIQSASYEFQAQVKPDNLRDYGELELGKANFRVQEKSALPDIYQEIALAVNLGDGSMAKKFKKLKIDPPQWIVLFDVADVKTKTTAFKFTDKNAASFAGALMGGLFLGASGAKMGEGLMGSVNSAEEQRQWDVTLGYRILDGATGQQLYQGQFTEQAVINRELKGFLGVDASEAGGITLSTVSLRLIQKAVQDIDKQYKLTAMAEAEAAAGKKKASGKKSVSAKTSKKQGKSAKSEEQPQDSGPEIACYEKSLGGFVCQVPADWSIGVPPSAMEAALAQKPELAKLINRNKGGKNSLIDTVVAFDILKTAGPLVTLSAPDSPLLKMGEAVALTGNDLEGRIFVFPNAAGKLTPDKLAEAVEGHMRRASVVEPLAVETVKSQGGEERPIMVYKYIKVEQRRELEEKPDWDQDAKDKYKFISIPHYNNMAMSIIPKGNDLLLVIVIAPEDKFLPQLDGVKKMVGSAA